jgi:ribosome-associated protein
VTPCCGFRTRFSIDEDDIDIAFVRASAPGGQNVNKLATAAQLRFDSHKAPCPTTPARG